MIDSASAVQGALVRAVALVHDVVLAAAILPGQPPGGVGDCVGCDALQFASPAPGP
jgi:hypothetical protein